MQKQFNYDGILPVRTVTGENGDIWFAGIDVCNILEYTNPSDILDKVLDEDEKKLDYLVDTSGQKRKSWTINEPGLYHLIFNSSKSEAIKFRKWVTSEVLPQIRKAGIYSTEQAQERELELQQLTKLINYKKTQQKSLKSDLRMLNTEVSKLEKDRDTLITDFRQTKITFPANENKSLIFNEEEE